MRVRSAVPQYVVDKCDGYYSAKTNDLSTGNSILHVITGIPTHVGLRQARFEDAYQINKESSHLREKLDLPRITYVERLVDDKRKKILATVSPDMQAVQVNLTIYDLIDKLWGYFDTAPVQSEQSVH